MYSGFFDLKKPGDLLRKLEHDYHRIVNSPADRFAALDFFVTAYHLVDWLHPTDAAARRQLVDNSPLLRICRELANGSKHFSSPADAVEAGKMPKKVLDDPAVQGTTVAGAVFDGDVFDSDVFQTEDSLIVEPDGSAAQTLGPRIPVRQSALRESL